MATLTTDRVSTRSMTYDAEAGLLVAEASTLGIGHGKSYGRIYDDACDVGLTVVSHLTGREVLYAVIGTATRDGDVLYDDLAPIGVDGLPTLRIFND